MKTNFLLLFICLFASCSFNNEYEYILDLPAGYDETKAYPLMIFLHGAGERGRDLEKVKVHGPPMMVAAGHQFPCIVVSPQCPKRKHWEPEKLEIMLAEVKAKHHIDPSRIYLTGLSMGGYGTLDWAYEHPEHFAALVPICGGKVNPEKIERIRNIPMWAFHGAKDEVVPIEQTEEYIDALEKVGGRPKYTEYSGANHDSWTRTYSNQEVFDWMFAQKK